MLRAGGFQPCNRFNRAGIVDQDIQPAKTLLCDTHRICNVLVAANVTRYRNGLVADFAGDTPGILKRPGSEHHVCPVFNQFAGCGLANPPARASYQCGFAA